MWFFRVVDTASLCLVIFFCTFQLTPEIINLLSIIRIYSSGDSQFEQKTEKGGGEEEVGRTCVGNLTVRRGYET